MTIISSKNILAVSGFSAALLFTGSAGYAAENPNIGTMKPLHGLSFDVGAKRAVSYFVSVNGSCKLVLTIAEEPKWDEFSSFTATRFEAAIPAGKATRFNPTEGTALRFECQAGAQAMSVETVVQFAYSGGG